MNKTYFYFTPRCYKILTTDQPISLPVLDTLSHDFGGSLNRKVEAIVPISKEQKDKNVSAIKTAQYSHKAFKKTGRYSQERDETVRQLLASRTPNFGSIRLTVTKQGV